MKNLIIGLCFLLSYNAQAQQKASIVYDENAQVRNVASFTAIKVSSAIELYLTQSSSNKVAVSASTTAIRDHIITEVVGGTLIIRLGDSGNWFSWKKWGNYKTKAYVSIKDINAILGSGATNINIINTIESPKITIKLTGASDLKGEIKSGALNYDLSGASHCKAQVEAGTIAITSSGASSIELTGKVEDLSVIISGASDAKLYNLSAKGALLDASGASSIQSTVTEILRARSSGASTIHYKGDPRVRESNASGAANIRRRD